MIGIEKDMPKRWIFVLILYSHPLELQEVRAMNQITISLTEAQSRKLAESAARFDITPQELMQRQFEVLIDHLAPEVDETLEYLLSKNAELYRRLA